MSEKATNMHHHTRVQACGRLHESTHQVNPCHAWQVPEVSTSNTCSGSRSSRRSSSSSSGSYPRILGWMKCPDDCRTPNVNCCRDAVDGTYSTIEMALDGTYSKVQHVVTTIHVVNAECDSDNL